MGPFSSYLLIRSFRLPFPGSFDLPSNKHWGQVWCPGHTGKQLTAVRGEQGRGAGEGLQATVSLS